MPLRQVCRFVVMLVRELLRVQTLVRRAGSETGIYMTIVSRRDDVRAKTICLCAETSTALDE